MVESDSKKCIFEKCIFENCIFEKCIFEKCIFEKLGFLVCAEVQRERALAAYYEDFVRKVRSPAGSLEVVQKSAHGSSSF